MIIKKNKKLQIETKAAEANVPLLEAEIEQVQTEVFDADNFDFLQRDERRRGDRRRGYRRIDDRNLVSRAQQEALSIKEQAIQDGYNQGLNQSLTDVTQIKEALGEFFEYKDRIVSELSKDILSISLDIAETIIKKEVEQDRAILLNIITDILNNNAKNENRITLKVSPEDAEFLRISVSKVLSMAQIEAKILVMEAENIQPGSVVVETSNGVVDANFTTQLAVLREAFKGI